MNVDATEPIIEILGRAWAPVVLNLRHKQSRLN